MRIDFGSVTITDEALRFAREDVRVSFFNSVTSIASIHGEVYIEITDAVAADLFAVLSEYLPIRKDEGEEARVRDIIGQETPD